MVGASLDPVAATIGDLDSDGRPDLVSAEFTFSSTLVTVRHGTPGGFAAPDIHLAGPSLVHSLATGEIDGIPHGDVLVGSLDFQLAATIQLLRASGTDFVADQSFSLPAGHDPTFLVCTDLDGDGRDDVVAIDDDPLLV